MTLKPRINHILRITAFAALIYLGSSGTDRDSSKSASLGKAHFYAIDNHPSGRSSVPGLLFAGFPAAIPGHISEIVFKPSDGVLIIWDGATHVSNEYQKIRSPLGANGDPSRSVISKLFAFRIIAPLLHVIPDAISANEVRICRCAMRPVLFTRDSDSPASATFSSPASKVIYAKDLHLSAFASAPYLGGNLMNCWRVNRSNGHVTKDSSNIFHSVYSIHQSEVVNS